MCEFIFRNVCFEFVWESKTWSQAGDSCDRRGGKLLKVITSPMKIMLKSITVNRNISKFTWWLGTGIMHLYIIIQSGIIERSSSLPMLSLF